MPVLPFFALSFEAGYGLVGLVLAAEGLGNLLLQRARGHGYAAASGRSAP